MSWPASGGNTLSKSPDGSANGINTGNGSVPIALANPRGLHIFLGDSLTYGGQPGRKTGFYDGVPLYIATTITNTNIGGPSWIAFGRVDGRAGTAGGTLQTDGTGKLQWKYGTDSYGPLVDVSQGGWFQLDSGTLPNSGIMVAVRGATAFPTVSGTGAVVTSGIPNINDYDLLGYVAWVAGALPDTFLDYRAYGISGSTSADILKFAPQALLGNVEAVSILMGVNDNPNTAATATASIANIKSTIDLARAKARRVYVCDIFPNPSTSATVQGFLARVSSVIRAYCRTFPNVRFVSAWGNMISPSAIAVAGRTGVYNTDNLHLMAYGGYVAAAPLIAAILQDYPKEATRNCTIDTYDTTLQVGSWNANPGLRGTAGTVVAANGITGTAPDGWTLLRNGSTQLLTTAFEAAADKGLDWFTLAVSAATGGDRHSLAGSVAAAIPAGVGVGDSFRVMIEVCLMGMTGNGLSTFQLQANSNGNIQSAYPLQNVRNVATFSTEMPVLRFYSEPQKLLAGVTNFALEMRIGGADAAATGKIGIRQFRIEKA